MDPDLVLSQYIFLQKLGEGGMGEVWKGKHAYLDYEVAIKFLKSQYADDAGLQERFLNEGKRQANLDHPNIVRAIDFVTNAGRHYLVMKFVEGGGLDGRIADAGGPLPTADAIDISYQILSALGYAHAKGVVHRDVKPSNVLIDRDGQCYLTDFGIALAVGQTRITHTGAVMGTPWYMSPEQIRTPHTVDRRTDIYAFGVVLFEMLTGVPPFDAEGGNDFTIKQAHVEQPPPKPSKLNPAVPKSVEAVVLRALAKDREDRWSTCEQMSEALEKASHLPKPLTRQTRPQGAPTPAQPGVPSGSARQDLQPSTEGVPDGAKPQRRLSRNKAQFAAGIVLTIALGALMAVQGWRVRLGPAGGDALPTRGADAPGGDMKPSPDRGQKLGTDPAENGTESGHVTDGGQPALHPGGMAPPGQSARPLSRSKESPSEEKGAPAPISNREPAGPTTPPTQPRTAEAEQPKVTPPEIAVTLPKNPQSNIPAPPVTQAPPGGKIVTDEGPPSYRGRPDIIQPHASVPPVSSNSVAPSGPSSGTLMWSVDLKKDAVLNLTGGSANAGKVWGQMLPGFPVSISITPSGLVGVVEPPGPSNGWNTLTLRSRANSNVVIYIHWERL